MNIHPIDVEFEYLDDLDEIESTGIFPDSPTRLDWLILAQIVPWGHHDEYTKYLDTLNL